MVSTASSNVITVPRLDSPLIDDLKIITPPWHRFLIDLWRRTGASSGAIDQVVYLLEQDDGSIGVYDSQHNTLLGILFLRLPQGPNAEPQVPSGHSFDYQALVYGTLVSSSGALVLERRGVFAPCGLAGGAIPMLPGDIAHVTWYNDPPTIVWFPNY